MKKLQRTVVGIVLVLMAGMCPAVWAQDAEDTQGAEKEGTQWKREPCSQWSDTALRVAFPREIGGLTMQERSVSPRVDAYTLRYLPSDNQRRPESCRLDLLDITVIKSKTLRSSNGTGKEEDFPNGVGPQIRRFFDGFVQDKFIQNQQYADVTDIAEGTFQHVVQKYLWSSCSYSERHGDIVVPCRQINLVTAFNWGIVHLCYVVARAAEHLETSDTFKAVLDAVGRMFKESVEASAVDVYAIADPKAALAAVRRKWPGAADRISMWEMPKHAKTFFEIDSLQDWCNDDPPKRYRHFEQACKRAVDLRIEPPVWYYNLACARAVQGKTDAAFEALEQATAAGLGIGTSFGDDISKDADFTSITNDFRFAKLCAMMRVDERQS